MSRTAPLQVSQLEEREVPSAAMFADIRAGIWGSYPLNLTPSGSTLFFSADNGHGYELYATDGTPGSVHLVKDVKPGLGGSNPGQFFTADGGVVYFTADDGTGRALWRSDGTAAGTKKVPGMPADATPDLMLAIGHDGKLDFLTGGATAGDPTGGGRPVSWWTTDGTTTTLLHAFPGVSGVATRFESIGGQLALVRRYSPGDYFESAWVTDGTPGGTRFWQQAMTGFDGRIGWATLTPGVEVAPGRFVHANLAYVNGNSALWVSNGTAGSAALLAVLGTTVAKSYIATPPVLLGGKAYVAVQSPDPAVAGLWVTDGTAAGTHRTDAAIGTGLFSIFALTPFNGRLLVQSGETLTGYRYFLTDGTAAGTAEVPRPAGVTKPVLAAMVPPGPGEPAGALLFVSDYGGPLYRTDGTAAGTAWVDPTGLPTGGRPFLYPTDALGRVAQNYPAGGAYFRGAIYFPAANGDQRSELWKWDAGPPPVTQPIAPQVMGVTVNDGSAQRSVVTKLTVTFDRVVNLGVGAVTLTSTNGPIPVGYVLNLDPETVNGRTVLTITFGQANGAQLMDGRLTLTVSAAKVTDAATGGALAADYTFNFTKLYGDLNGDGTYDREARVLVHNSLGLRVGDAGYLVALDSNNDGVIDATDELAVVRNWGRSV